MVESLKSINIVMVDSLFWNPAFDVAPAARWWAMSKDWWRLRPGAFLAPASYFFVVELRILGDPWIVGEAKHHSCFLSDIVSVEGGHQKPFVRTPLVLQTINQLIKWFFHNMTQEPVYLSNAGWQDLAGFRRGQKWPWNLSSSAYLQFSRQMRRFCA